MAPNWLQLPSRSFLLRYKTWVVASLATVCLLASLFWSPTFRSFAHDHFTQLWKTLIGLTFLAISLALASSWKKSAAQEKEGSKHLIRKLWTVDVVVPIMLTSISTVALGLVTNSLDRKMQERAPTTEEFHRNHDIAELVGYSLQMQTAQFLDQSGLGKSDAATLRAVIPQIASRWLAICIDEEESQKELTRRVTGRSLIPYLMNPQLSALDQEAWGQIIDQWTAGEEETLTPETRAALSAHISLGFAHSVREAIKHDAVHGGKGSAGIQLELAVEILRRIEHSSFQLAEVQQAALGIQSACARIHHSLTDSEIQASRRYVRLTESLSSVQRRLRGIELSISEHKQRFGDWSEKVEVKVDKILSFVTPPKPESQPAPQAGTADLVQWLEEERLLRIHAPLPSEEAATSPKAQAWIRSAIRLWEFYNSVNAWEESKLVAQRIARISPKITSELAEQQQSGNAQAWPFETLEFWKQHKIAEQLRKWKELQAARDLSLGVLQLSREACTAFPMDEDRKLCLVYSLLVTALVYEDLGQFAHSSALSHEAFKFARTFAQKRDARWKLETLALTHRSLAELNARQRSDAGAGPHFEASLALLKEADDRFGTTPKSQEDLAINLLLLANHYRDWSRRDKANDFYEQTIQIRRGLLGEEGLNNDPGEFLAYGLATYADYQASLGALEPALSKFEEAIALRLEASQRLGLRPQNAELLSSTYVSQAAALKELHRVPEAIDALENAVQSAEELLRVYPKNLGALRLLLKAYPDYANLQHSVGKGTAAQELFLKAIEHGRQLTSHEVDRISDTFALVDAHLEYGTFLRERSEYEEAKRQLDEAIDLCQSAQEVFPRTLEVLNGSAVALDRRGNLFWQLGEYSAATSDFQSSLLLRNECLQAYGSRPSTLHGLAFCLGQLGDVEQAQHNLKEARAYFQESLGYRVQILDEYGETVQRLQSEYTMRQRIADIDLATGATNAALDTYQSCLRITRRIYEQLSPTRRSARDYAVMQLKVASVLDATGKGEEARQMFRSAIAAAEERGSRFGVDRYVLADRATYWFHLGSSEKRAGNWEGASSAYEEGLQDSRVLMKEHATWLKSYEIQSALLTEVSNLWVERKEWEKSARSLSQAVDTWESAIEAIGSQEPIVAALARAHRHEGFTHDKSKNLESAVESLSACVSSWRILLGSNPKSETYRRELSNDLVRLGNYLDQLGHANQGQTHFLEALELRRVLAEDREKGSEAHRDLAFALNRAAAIEFDAGRVEQAHVMRSEALQYRRDRYHRTPDQRTCMELLDAYYQVAQSFFALGQSNQGHQHISLAKEVIAAHEASWTNVDTKMLHDWLNSLTASED